MNKHSSIVIKALLCGFGISIFHFLLSVVLGIYYGLGMDKAGAKFTISFFMQPGTAINNAHESVNPLVVNAVFYFFIGFVGTYLFFLKKSKSNKSNFENV
jgi:ABC-type Mn2+/Zn2+ transport system permease subunit